MEVMNELYPSDVDSFQQRLASGSDESVVMVNLLKFKPVAEYDHEDEPTISGEEAYGKYISAVKLVLPELGARVVYEGKLTFLGIGQVEELWDKVLLIEYPSLAALAALGAYESIQAALKHREAGLDGQLLIESKATD